MPDDVGIFVGDAPATDVQHVSPGEYTATTGANVVPGTYDVQIIDNSGNIITIPSAFTYQSNSSTTTTADTRDPGHDRGHDVAVDLSGEHESGTTAPATTTPTTTVSTTTGRSPRRRATGSRSPPHRPADP